jgi:hypothetical protein
MDPSFYLMLHFMLENSLNIQKSFSSDKPILEGPLSPIKKSVKGGLHGPASLAAMKQVSH